MFKGQIQMSMWLETEQMKRLKELGIHVAWVADWIDFDNQHTLNVLNGIEDDPNLLKAIDEFLQSDLVAAIERKGNANGAV